MVECSNTRNSRGLFHLKQTGMSDQYGPWHSHDSAPQMGPYTGLAEEHKKGVTTYTPPPRPSPCPISALVQ